MSVRVYPGDHITIAMNFAGSQAKAQEVADRLKEAYPQFVINIVDVYTMVPTVLWVQAPELPPREVTPNVGNGD